MLPGNVIGKFLPYFRLLKDVRWHFLGGVLAGIVFGLASGFALPTQLQPVLEPLFTERTLSGWELVAFVLVLPAIFLVRGLAGFLNAYLITYCGTRFVQEIRRRLFFHLQELELGYFTRRSTGDLMSRVTADASELQQGVVTVANDLVKQPVTFLGALGAVVYLSVQNGDVLYVLLALGVIPVIALPIRIVGKKVLARAQQSQRQTGALNAHVRENLAAAREVRLYNLQEREKTRFGGMLQQLLHYQMKIAKYREALGPSIEIAFSVGVTLALYYAYTRGVTLDVILPLVAALYLSYQPLKRLGQIHNQMRRAEASLDRIEEVLHHPPAIADPEAPVKLGTVRGAVVFENVSFSYDGEAAVLREVTERVQAGETIALVGPSGAGKSTFINLIPRLYDVSEGRVTLDGHDLRTLARTDLRAHIALVPQEALLFDDTIAANIRVGRPEASDGEVREAARRAFAADFIEALPQGYETRVNEGGLRLSGGQRQRVAIARAFLKDAPVLILDEPTSALDTESEQKVQEALRDLCEGRTTFIIAHRFSTIRDADRILLFHDGQIEDRGTHDELVRRSDLYRALYEGQRAGTPA